MNVLIVYAHPSPTSFNGAMKTAAIEELTQNNATVQVSDLYAMNFNPVAQLSDVTVPANDELIPTDLLTERQKVAWADLLIFQFPLWWTSTPAILKGWFDRVFAAGFAYGPGVYNHGGLKGKKAMLSITTGGKNLNSYGPLGLKGDMNERLFNLQHEILYFTGMDVLQPSIIPTGVSEFERLQYIHAFRNRLKTIHEEIPINFRPLEDYQNGQLKLNEEVGSANT
ncbi:putative NADPH-quinone reductase [Bacillus mesophilus]|uniref:NAD(P)H-dependent oxidoreductase n=1 Tax=Bacillus mesophilus TaxID=1808955 RepID=A0A6M0Q6T5_9BACI|nr:NAD(P)H-dependent oxidoreductase [Bacillus mesophilus]MBM7661320.1 putative NADPH-quinone reductase [Bacillus mesophilus]NEY71160.1 NAD(P)H-dependent oxidoreductase [Bacillus mesophilus]